MDATKKRRWYCPTPGWLVLGSLAVTGLLWLSNWLGWPAWHKGYAVLAAVAGVGMVLAVMLLWWLAALVFRWRFQFAVRTLLVLALAVALPCSWMAVELKKAEQERKAARALGRLCESVAWSDPSGPEWLRNLVGNGFLSHVVGVLRNAGDVISDEPRFGDTDAENLKALPQLRYLDLGYTDISDTGLENLQGLKLLKKLGLCNTKITDTGLQNLKGLNELEVLELGETKITDIGLENLKGLLQLRRLVLCDTHITDAGLHILSGLCGDSKK